MPTQSECERAIRHLAHEWISKHPEEKDDPNFYAFKRWCEDNGHGLYFRFKSNLKEQYAEIWLAEELGQMWRY